MMNKRIFITTLFIFSILSCTKKDEDYNYKWHPHDIMQRVKLVDKDGNWIEGIENAEIELIATDENWKNPLFDKNKNIIKQISGRVEAKKKLNKYNYSGVDWIELYMIHKDFSTSDDSVSTSSDSHFVLRVNNDSFRIRALYLLDFRRVNVLHSFFFEGKHFPVGTPHMASIVTITTKEEKQ